MSEPSPRVPRVSIVLPTFNRRALIGEAIESVLAQTERAFELLVVDDGSTDGTAEDVAARYADEPRVHVIRKPNGGSASARNRGLDDVRAPWTAFLDSDDIWDATYLARQLATADGHPDADAIVADLRLEGPWHRAGDTVFALPGWRPATSMSAMLDGGWALPTATLFRSSVIKRLRFDTEYSHNEDTELLFRFHASGHRLVLNREVLGAWRRHGEADAQPQKTLSEDGLTVEHLVLLEMYAHPEPRPRAIRRRIARMHAKRLLRDGRWKTARPYLWEWWRLRPTSTRAMRLLVKSYLASGARGSVRQVATCARPSPD